MAWRVRPPSGLKVPSPKPVVIPWAFSQAISPQKVLSMVTSAKGGAAHCGSRPSGAPAWR